MAIGPILDVMSQLIAAHEQLIALSEQKTGIIVNNNVEELNRIVGKESRLATQIAELDQMRIAVIGEYLTAKGYRPHPYITVSDIVKLVIKVEDKQQIQETQRKLSDIIKRLKTVNKQNQQLIEQSLAYINYSIDLIVGPPEDDAIYHRPEHQPIARRAGLFDTRA